MLPGRKQAGRRVRALSRLSLALLVLVAAQLVLAPYVAAQEAPNRPRNVFEFLFGGGIRKAKPDTEKPAVKRTNRTKASNKAAVAPREPEVVAVEKALTAKALLVVGDFNGNGLAEALATVYAAKADVRVVDRTNGSSGFVRDDFYNWPTEIVALMETEKPAAVVVMIGTNDRQEMRVAGAREPKRSENWTREYQARVTALAKAVRERGVPLVWVGLPSFKSTSMSSDMLAFNDIYRGAA
ncbi:MAG: DUF459 domain-containing protein, partial [Mesorhizobium sp.]|nr:DUF459 domain-containing protein [Mesorhizobium sp.]